MDNDNPPQNDPDVMNDPAYATNHDDDGSNEADTCRICRGEATDQEPLFYPCKCNGSIKFVHQDCLMEWLSHSQKKHCELCKTAFRFTKLYSPHMPQKLPLHIFAHRLFFHAVRFSITSMRFLLVAFVWLGWLPWAMRSVWRMLFWFAEGGWTERPYASKRSSTHIRAVQLAQARLENITAVLLARGSSPLPENSLQPKTTTSASVGDLIAIFPKFLEPVAATINATVGESMIWRQFADFFNNIGLHMTSSLPESPFANSNTSISVHKSNDSMPLSLLSEVSLLKDLTRWPSLNNLAIGVLEGQIITVLVVVCFILIFLIREWVVQQQPGINMGAGFNAEFAMPGRGDDIARAMQEEEEDEDQGHNDHLDPAPPNDFREFDLPDREHDRDPVPVADRRIAQPRRRLVRFEDEIIREEPEQEQNESSLSDNQAGIARPNNDVSEQQEQNGIVPHEARPLQNAIARRAQPQRGLSDATSSPGTPRGNRRRHGGAPQTSPQRPGMPTRDALSPAAEIQRRIEEEVRLQLTPEYSLHLEEFLSIYRRGEGNPDEVLRIIAAEGKEERLDYWVKTMRNVQNSASSSPKLPERTDSGNLTLRKASKDVDAPLPSSDETKETLDIKGKGKAVDTTSLISSSLLPDFNGTNFKGTWSFQTNEAQNNPFAADRPRANSDEPQFQENSPLIFNTWQFSSDLPSNIDPKENLGAEDANTSRPTEMWKEAQDNRVKEAVAKAREQHASKGLNSDGLGDEGSQPKNDDSKDLVEGKQDISTTTNSIHESPYDPKDISVRGGEAIENDEGPSDLSSVDAMEGIPAADAPELDGGALLAEQGAVARPQQEPLGTLDRIADWLWGDMEAGQPDDIPGNDEHVVQDIAAEPPFVPVPNAQNRDLRAEAEQADQNLEVLEAAIAAGLDPNDPDALDEQEEFDGILDLIGMRGPLTGLLQNGMFSAVLISLTVACGIWIPYNFGRLVLLLLAHPVSTAKLPLKLVFTSAELLIDMSLVVFGLLTYLVLCLAALPAALVSIASASVGSPAFITVSTFASQPWQVAVDASSRISSGFLSNVRHIADSEVPAFSATSHESLLILKSWVYDSFIWLGDSLVMSSSSRSTTDLSSQVLEGSFLATILEKVSSLPSILLDRSSWIITLNIPQRLTPLDPELATWSGVDRFWAIFAGYAALSVLGALYLRRGAPFSVSRTGKEWEAHIADLLNQAGGVMKVILIISIEMLVFPLYCGLLLDLALLPLFENASFISRIMFTLNSPLTSMFVHWFVGTCYMFHFALFVSMCRKIMRNGVLYFIRDPDDPTFHPVRDVLERNVYTQLRKITFSALVYGALVVICLGGVVWSLSFTFRGVLPIHWSSNEPVLEFPIDLLFYNFMMPLVVRFFKPSDGLHAMYSWWFRKCARMLRLTWFLFDERKEDEEGHHVYKKWYYIFSRGAKADTKSANVSQGQEAFQNDCNIRSEFVKDGNYVRTPASDQVRIPKGARVFLEVTEDDQRTDGQRDIASALHGRGQFKRVYIPPLFRFRLFVFILSIWIFAALTGVCITIVPLVFGREVFKMVIPNHLRTNDIYAFAIGIYILGSVLYCSIHMAHFLRWTKATLGNFITSTNSLDLLNRGMTFSFRAVKIIYLYSCFTLLLPTLLAMIVELYFIVPLHTYFSDGNERHITHFIQSWTLGLLYVKLGARFILWHNSSRAARAFRQITAEPNHYLDPNIRTATRFFILPVIIISLLALFLPLSLGYFTTKIINRFDFMGTGMNLNEVQEVVVYRYSYPGILLVGATMWLILGAVGVIGLWRTKIRDEVYLIGERLHNFGEGRRKAGLVISAGVGGRRVSP